MKHAFPKGPMLAVEAAPEVNLAEAGKANLLQFPMIAQIKFDGFRCIIPNGSPVTRTLKPIPNNHVRSKLNTLFGEHGTEDGSVVECSDHPLHGLDGELIALDPEDLSELDLHRTQSALNTVGGYPRFVFHVFDDFSIPNVDYLKRYENYQSRVKFIREMVPDARLETNPALRSKRIHDHVFQATSAKICERIEDVLEFESEVLAWSGEGIMLKSISGKYKFGRSTLREGLCLKVKRFTDDEATIVGFIEKMRNDNEATTDERGYTKRSSAKDGLVPAGTLGALVLSWNNLEFEIGTGWCAETASEIWRNRSEYMGCKVNFKYKGTGPNGKPLIPSFQGVRYDV